MGPAINQLASDIRAGAPLLTAAIHTIMQTREVRLRNRLGLHARACAKIVKLASRFRCRVSLVFDGRRANARNILAVMMLRREHGHHHPPQDRRAGRGSGDDCNDGAHQRSVRRGRLSKRRPAGAACE